MRNTKSKIMIIMSAVLCIMAVGYAAFSTVLTITGTANIASEWKVVFTKIEQVSKTDGVNVKSTPSASGTTATFNVGLTSPGDKIVYKITLANQGTIDAVIKNIQASATDSPAIIFTIEGVNTGDVINNKTSKDFTVTIEYDPHVTSQPDKLQKTLTVSIVTEQYVNQSIDPSTPSVEQPTYLRSEILKNNVAYADTNIDFKYSSEGCYYENGEDICDDSKATNGLYYTNTNTENNLTTYYFRGDVDNNYVKFGARDTCTYNGENVGYVVFDASMNPTLYEWPTQSQCESTKVCDAGTIIRDNYGMDYRYVVGIEPTICSAMGGTPTGKDATYAEYDMYWRIVRINEDGSIRLIYQGNSANSTGTIDYSEYNTDYEMAEYVGYMYTLGSAAGRGTDSIIKGVLDTWYNNNLSNYSSYLTTTGFCNDRSLDVGTGIGTTRIEYGAYNRLYNNKNPQFGCPNSTDDLFTTKIGLITADEVAYAGGVEVTGNYSYYLNNGTSYWTMSPGGFFGWYAGVCLVGSDGSLLSGEIDDFLGVRPVINLRSDVEIISGDGRIGSEYVIK